MLLILHCVFHSIRFKVNKGWDSAEPLFLCLVVKARLWRGRYAVLLHRFRFVFSLIMV